MVEDDRRKRREHLKRINANEPPPDAKLHLGKSRNGDTPNVSGCAVTGLALALAATGVGIELVRWLA